MAERESKSSKSTARTSTTCEPTPAKKIDELSLEFSAMVADVADILHKSPAVLNKLKLVCYSITTTEKSLLFSEKESVAIRASQSVFDVFYELRGHWRWDNTHLLFAIIKRSGSQEALAKYEQFQNKADYAKTLKELTEYYQSVQRPLPSNCTRMIAIIEKDYSDFTVRECQELDDCLADAFGSVALPPANVEGFGSIKVTWFIPIEAVSGVLSKAYHSKELFKLLSISYFEIDEVVIWNEKWSLQKQKEVEISDLTTRLNITTLKNTKLDMLLKHRSGDQEFLKQLEVKVNKYELLGSGNYGEVWKVQYKDKLYAGKLLYRILLPGYPSASANMHKLTEQFTLKRSLASTFSHPCVEQFVEIAHTKIENIPVIITELLSENLTVYINCTSDTLHCDLQLSICNDMAQGLLYLHSRQLVHRNLHAANVLMTLDHHAKIADYLCPYLLTDVAPDSSSVYLPPETTQDNRTTEQSNVFTLAVLVLQVVTKCSPQPSNDLSLSELERCSTDLHMVPKCHPLLAIIQQCLNNHEMARPLMREVYARLLESKDSTQMMVFKLIHTTEYPLLLPALSSGRYQLQHISCQNVLVPMYWAYAVTIGMMVYVTGGNSRNGDVLEHVFRFDLENNKWDKLLPPSEYHHGVPVVLKGKLSLIGGRIPKNKTVVGKIKTYDEDESQWVTIYPDMNVPRYRPAVVTTDSHTVVMGGKIQRHTMFTRDNKLTDSIEVMSINDKQWTTVATPLPTKMYDISATISNDLIWIIGYDDGDTRYNKVFTVPLDNLIRLTNAKHPWKQLCNDAVCFKTANICYSDSPVILGGDDKQNQTISAVVVFDPKTESWNEVATLSSPRAHCAVATLPGERGIIVIGGCSETQDLGKCNSSCLNTTEIYYISSGIHADLLN